MANEENAHRPVRRRSFIGMLCAGSALLYLPALKAHEERIILNNVETTAWVVTEDTRNLTETDTENPEIVLVVGRRYSFGNNGWNTRPFGQEAGTHPLELRDSNDRPLLSQDRRGRYEDDEDVNWEDEGNVVSFNVTERLARELNGYACTEHRDMQGDVRVVTEEELMEDEEDATEDGDGERRTETDDAEDTEEERLPGFGVLVGMVSLVCAPLVRRRFK